MNIEDEWTFKSEEVADGFDKHVREQLPWYPMVMKAVAHVARHYIPRGGRVYDIGASTGNVGNALVDTLNKRRAEYIPIEVSPEMCERFAGPQAGRLLQEDACEVTYQPYDVAICFLTLMFLTIEGRAGLLKKLRKNLRPGGAIIVLDKTAGFNGYPGVVMWRLTLAGKVAAGVDPGEVVRKELSLRGVQRPLHRHELGSDAVEWFRFGDFAGWLIEA